MKLQHLVTGGVSSDELHLAAGTPQYLCDQTLESLIRGRIDGRRRNPDTQLIAQRLPDFLD